jgi:hypothetical protein
MIIRRKKLWSWGWKKITIDWIKFASKEEAECYTHLRDWTLYKETQIEDLKGVTLLEARPKAYNLFNSFVAWKYKVLARRYTADFVIQLSTKEIILLEYKSAFTESKSDYRLRRSLFLFFYRDTIKFAELIKIKKWNYIFKKYY